MRFVQPIVGCSDIDVVLSNRETPSYRMLLPEWIFADEITVLRHVHIIPGAWETTPKGLNGSFYATKDIQVSVETRGGDCVCPITLCVVNRSDSPLSNVRANVGLVPNRVSGGPAWSNQAFLGDHLLDRRVQGRYWYEHVAPHNARVFTANGWIGAHARPDDPDPDAVEEFHMQPYVDTPVSAYATSALDGTQLLFQTWAAPCRFVAPYPGNTTMVLLATLAQTLAPRESAEIHGAMGIFLGTWDDLATALREGRFTQEDEDRE